MQNWTVYFSGGAKRVYLAFCFSAQIKNAIYSITPHRNFTTEGRIAQSSFGLVRVFSETKIPSRNFLSSLSPILQTWLTLAQQRETFWMSIPSKTSSSLTSLERKTVQPGYNLIRWDFFPPRKFLISIYFWSLEITALIGKCAWTNLILYLKPYRHQINLSIIKLILYNLLLIYP